jgi:hypothetical protein
MSTGLPSKDRLRELKAEGVFSWSSLATRSAVAAAALGALLLCVEWLGVLARDLSGDDAIGVFQGLGRGVLHVVLVTAVVSICVGLMFSLTQTRGAFGGAALRTARRKGLFTNPLKPLFSLLLTAAFAGVLAYTVVPELMSLVRSAYEPASLPGRLGAVFGQICKLLVVASFVLAILLLFVTRVAFLVRLSRGRGRGNARGQQ